jgi:hypothetical protein
MRLSFHKLSDESHELSVLRADGTSDRATVETRSLLMHDLLHLAVEHAARLEDGLWGQLARGTSLAALKADAPATFADPRAALAVVERIVGAMHGLTQGKPADQVFAGLADYAANLGDPLPDWCDEGFVRRVETTLRALQGRWRATPFGKAMTLDWPDL